MRQPDDAVVTALATALSYEAYLQLTDQLLAQNKTTGPDGKNPQLVAYTVLNRQRMKRLDKVAVIQEELQQKLMNVQRPYTWLLITEPWCGDAAQNIPVLAKMAALSLNIDLKLVLRDEHLPLMDKYLTNGGRAIPKLIVLDTLTLDELATWGPRPAVVQQMVADYKALPEPKVPYAEFTKDVQLWYQHDKTQSLQQEIFHLLQGLE